jgi:DNA-binding NtrC family response regulator
VDNAITSPLPKLPELAPSSSAPPPPPPLSETELPPLRLARRAAVDAFELRYLQALLAKAGGNVTRAAALAQVSRQAIHLLMSKHGL